MIDEPADPMVTVVIRRRTKPGCETPFEVAMQEFVLYALAFPGNRGIHVIRSEHANPREYTVVHRFADAKARRTFIASPPYRDWMVRLRELTDGDPHIEKTGGLSGWFTLPDMPKAKAPSKLKMALTTFIGVYPLTSILPPLAKRFLPTWPPLLANVLVTGLIVALLSWVVMPCLTRLFRKWLFQTN
ncbi:antibiotic biosynthesis monooxygenase [Luteolibacter pohnpeiensis]|uniref:Antibiotic biosynthesis monooxygenase n=1 Tax=Luteolibacter pohnpeiensis TaxID=454153 RepID=A0A934VTB5_9BACT|nr:antibiotic biosynthesis monooxygenase [Luteolibacter pohnpeiensis]MBK1881317.1 antibiotic biosynthesis monooxygenase [Luteolibacter pohnpeiensis]